MVFKLARTYSDPETSQQGFPSPGDGAQTTGVGTPPPAYVPRIPERPTKGYASWLSPASPQDAARGFPTPDDPNQHRPPGIMNAIAQMFGGVFQKETPYYDRGAAAFVPNFGKVLYNPIGAGIPVAYRPQASYGGAAQYANGALWWTSQVIPTSINLQGLTTPDELNDILNSVEIQAVVRTTG
jgi:hypothetical protein